MAMFKPGDEDAMEKMSKMFGPAHIDQQIRQAIQHCWMSLPKERRTTDELETQVRRIFDRALRDFREDQQAFDRT
jgi:hypothetical protein